MSEPNLTRPDSHERSTDQAQPSEPTPKSANEAPAQPSAQSNSALDASVLRRRARRNWSRLALGVALVVVIATGVFATHRLLTYGTLTPSIVGGWYGYYSVSQADTAQYTAMFSLYIEFTRGPGNQVSATTSSCSVGGGPRPAQVPSAGLGFSGTINGAHFTMTAPNGDVESDLTWSGTYSTDHIHIDFYPDGTPTAQGPYANLQRGSYDDFLRTCAQK
jgi:hypothetical protein